MALDDSYSSGTGVGKHCSRLLFNQNGFATFLLSVCPVTGSLNSFQLIGYIAFPASLVAIMTPNSFFAVLR